MKNTYVRITFEMIDFPKHLPRHAAAVHKLAPLIQGRTEESNLSCKPIQTSKNLK